MLSQALGLPNQPTSKQSSEDEDRDTPLPVKRIKSGAIHKLSVERVGKRHENCVVTVTEMPTYTILTFDYGEMDTSRKEKERHTKNHLAQNSNGWTERGGTLMVWSTNQSYGQNPVAQKPPGAEQ